MGLDHHQGDAAIGSYGTNAHIGSPN